MRQKKEKRHIREQARETAQCGTGNAGRCGSGAERQPSPKADAESCRLPVWLSHRCGEGTEDVWAEVLTGYFSASRNFNPDGCFGRYPSVSTFPLRDHGVRNAKRFS